MQTSRPYSKSLRALGRATLMFAAGINLCWGASNPPGFTSDFTPLVGTGKTNFRQIFALTSPGVVNGNSEVVLNSSLGGNRDFKSRTFVPPGVKTMELTLNVTDANEAAAVDIRMFTPPIGFSTSSPTPSGTLQSLLAGDESRLTGPLMNSVFPIAIKSAGQTSFSTRGGWVYLDIINAPGNLINQSSVSVVADIGCYSKWLATAQFDANGNPSESAEHTCDNINVDISNPLPGGASLNALTGIQLSDSVIYNRSTTGIQITPIPASIPLTGCTALSMDGSLSNLVSVAGNTVRVTAIAGSIGADTPLLIQCGSVGATLTIQPAPKLTAITLSSPSLLKGSAAALTISPIPSAAILPPCTALNSLGSTSFLVKFSDSQLTLDAGSNNITSSTPLTIRCGTATSAFTIVVTPIPPLASIALSATTISKSSVDSVTIFPSPSNVSLPSCTALNTAGGPSTMVRISGNAITLTTAAAALATATTVTISCGSVRTALTITVPATNMPLDASGNVVVRYAFRPLAADIGKAGKLVVGALMPANSVFSPQDRWYFLTPSEWKFFQFANVISLDSLAYQSFDRLASSIDLSIPLGMPPTSAQAASLKLFIGYYTADGNFKSLGNFWSAN